MIKVISQPCGAGKGLWINEQIEKNKMKTIIVQETKQLLEQSYKNLKRFADGEPIKKKIIISGTGRVNLLQEIIESLKTDADVLFITDKMFHKIPVDKLRDHRIFIDDCPASFEYKIKRISLDEREQWFELYNKMFVLKDEYKPGFRYFDLTTTSSTSDDTRRIRDEYKKFEMYHEKVIATDFFEGGNVLTVFGWYDYNRYIDLDMTVLMNRFEDSILCKMTPGIFVPEQTFKPVESFNENNMERLTVRYFSKGRGQKGLSSAKVTGEEMRRVNDALRDILDGEYIWASNNNSVLSLPGVKVPINQRGINAYRDYEEFVFMASCNPDKYAIPYMNALFGLDGDDWMMEKELELMNQFAFRTALRKYDDTLVVGYVYDIEQAEYFEKAGAKIEFIDIGLHVKKNPKQSDIPAKERNKFRVWKSKAKGSYDGFDKWADLQIRKGMKAEWIETFRNSLNS